MLRMWGDDDDDYIRYRDCSPTYRREEAARFVDDVASPLVTVGVLIDVATRAAERIPGVVIGIKLHRKSNDADATNSVDSSSGRAVKRFKKHIGTDDRLVVAETSLQDS
jgi:hypothetical protein